MRIARRFSLLLIVVSVVLAQTQMNVEQLAQFIHSELTLKHRNDREIGAYVRKIQLSEGLQEKTILDFEAQGAGPKTVAALRALRDQTANMRPGMAAQAPVIPPPSSTRQQEMLQSIKDYAAAYTQHLPNFFCLQRTRQYIDPNGGASYRSGATILATLSYNEGNERYNVYSVSGELQPEGATMEAVKAGGAAPFVEFGSLMRGIFAPESEAKFEWEKWTTLRGRRRAVFHYSVERSRSDKFIVYDAFGPDKQLVVTAYNGFIYSDPATGAVARITFAASGIPPKFPIIETSEILDYDPINISGQQFVAPLAAKLFMKTSRESSKNEIEFRNYRKFDTGTAVTYDPDTNVPPPLSDAATEEKPATLSKRENPSLLLPPPPSH